MGMIEPDVGEVAPAERGALGARAALAAIAVAAVVVTAGYWLWSSGSVSELSDPQRIRGLVGAAGSAAPLAFIALLVSLNPFFLAGAPIWISSTLFPTPLAIAYSIVGAVVASTATHLAARYAGADWARSRIPRRLHRFTERVEQRPLRSVGALRMLLWINPGVDFLMAVSQVRLRDYLLGTLIGIALPTALRVYVGQKGIEAAQGPNAWVVAGLLTVVLALVLVRRYRSDAGAAAVELAPGDDTPVG